MKLKQNKCKTSWQTRKSANARSGEMLTISFCICIRRHAVWCRMACKNCCECQGDRNMERDSCKRGSVAVSCVVKASLIRSLIKHQWNDFLHTCF